MLGVMSSGYVHADDAQTRIKQLENQMQMMSEQFNERFKALQEELRQVQSGSAKQVSDKVLVEDTTTVHASFKDGLVFKDVSGDWSFRPYVRLQLDGHYYAPDAFAADTFSMRRARLGVIGTFLKDFAVRIEGEYGEGGASATGNTRLNDAYLEYNHWPSANIRMGQFKPYYGLERTMGAMDLNFMERAMSDNLAGSVFDRGLMVHGEPTAGLYYSVAYVNGTGQNVDENSADAKHDSKDLTARLTGNIAQWTGWKDSVVHLGGWLAYGRQGAGSAVPAVRTEGRGVTFFSTTNTVTTSSVKDTFATVANRTRAGFETALAYGPVKFQGEYLYANFNGTGFDRDMSAWYTSLQWLATGEHTRIFIRSPHLAAYYPSVISMAQMDGER